MKILQKVGHFCILDARQLNAMVYFTVTVGSEILESVNVLELDVSKTGDCVRRLITVENHSFSFGLVDRITKTSEDIVKLFL